MKEISIIVPVYNTSKYLKKCIKSLVSQKECGIDYEIIIVNDGSTDDSEEIVLEFAKKYKNIVYVKKKNGGVSSARNDGIKRAKGKYIMFVDSDDYIQDDLISIFKKKANDEDLFVFGYYEIQDVKQQKNTINSDMVLNKKSALSMFFENKSVRGYTWNKIFKKEIIEKNNLTFVKEITYLEDLTFVIKYLEFCEKIYFCSDALYNYVIREGSLINSAFNRKKLSSLDGYKIISKIVEKIDDTYIPTIRYFIFELDYELSVRIKICNNYDEYINDYDCLRKEMEKEYRSFIFKKTKLKYKIKASIKYLFYDLLLIKFRR